MTELRGSGAITDEYLELVKQRQEILEKHPKLADGGQEAKIQQLINSQKVVS